MTWDDVIKVVITAIGGLGGIAIIIGAVIKFSANQIAERLSAKYELRLNKELEAFKSGLEKKSYVSKVRFDAEFALYRELTVACRCMVNDVYFIYPSSVANVPVNEDDRRTHEQEVYDQACKSRNEFNRLLNSNAPFIPKTFFDSYMDLSKLCKQNIDVYAYRWNKGYIGNWEGSKDKQDAEDKAYQRTAEFTERFDSLIDDIRNYLSQLDVNE